MKHIFKIVLFFIVSNSLNTLSIEKFSKVIIWGHKLHSHTHSYIHYGLYKAFNHLGYKTYWFDKHDNLQNFDFSNSLFITEGQADENIPLRLDSLYILHNCTSSKYKDLLENNRCIILQVYTKDVLERDVKNIHDLIFTDQKNKIIYMTWATDLLPHEIDAIKEKLMQQRPIRKNVVNWIGTVGDGFFGNISKLNPFIKACKENKIFFQSKLCQVSLENNIAMIQESIVAPAIVGEWQEKQGYVPCRIFKNISYGQMGVTNSKTVYELFDKKIIYNSDTYQLFYEAYAWAQNPNWQQLFDLMDLVKERHTYINRINDLLDFFNMIFSN